MGKLTLLREIRTPLLNHDYLSEDYFGLTLASMLEEIAVVYKEHPDTPLPSYIRVGLAKEYPEVQLIVMVFRGEL